jgi:hypothetical protein
MSAFRPVFIGGAGRSGTTLAVDLLGTHASLSPVYETDFVLGVAREMLARRPIPESAAAIRRLMGQWTEPLPLRPHNKRAHERYLHGPHYILFERGFALEATETFIEELATDPIGGFRRFIGTLFARHAELDGKPFWVNKTPAYITALPFLQRVWPDLLFVHCVRDGRDVAASVLTRPWGPNNWADAGTWWRDQVRPGLEFAAKNPGQVAVLRYEELLERPTQALEGVLGALGLGGAAETVERYLATGANLDPARTGGWKSESEADIQAFEDGGGGTLNVLGYERAYAGV